MPTLNNIGQSTAQPNDQVLVNRGGVPGGAVGTDYTVPVSSITSISFPTIPAGTLLGYAGPNSTGTAAPLFSLPGANASSLLVEVVGGTLRTLASRAQDVANIADFGAPLDTVYGRTTVSSIAGSNVVTIGGIPSSMADGVAQIVVTGIGPSAAVSCTVSVGGTGYVAGDTIVLAGGTPLTACTVTVLVAPSGVITYAAVTTPGSYNVLPSNPVAQQSTSGSGTGATFVMGWIGLPVATTITSIAGTAVTLATAASTTITASDQWIAYGHDNAPAINAAINSGTHCIYLPSDHPIGIFSSITLPTSHQYLFEGNGTTLVALAPMSSMLNTFNSSFWDTAGSMCHNLTLDGLGIAQYNVNEERANHFWCNLQLLNASVCNLYTSQHESINNFFDTILIYNTVRPPGALVCPYPYALINVSDVTNTDNHFSQIIGAGAQNGVVDQSGGGVFWSDIHVYEITAGPSYSFNATVRATNIYADNPAFGQPGLLINGNYSKVEGYTVYGANCYTLQFTNTAVKNSVTGVSELISTPQLNVYPGIGALNPENYVNILGAVAPFAGNSNTSSGNAIVGAGTGASVISTTINAIQITCGAGASNSIKVGMPTALTGWAGTMANVTTTSITAKQVAVTSTYMIFSLSSAPNSGDVLVVMCQAY